jgi:3D (Asp-Asp-Asp) domain-containing protein
MLIAASLFSAAVLAHIPKPGVAFAQQSSTKDGDKPTTADQKSQGASAHVNATANAGSDNSTKNDSMTKSQKPNAAGMGANASASYKPTYPGERADSKRPFTVHAENHLYKPGDEVHVEGSIWSSLIDDIGGNALSVKLNVTDNKGNMTAQKDVNVEVNATGGQFSTTFTLPADAEQGSYKIDALIEANASLLDTLNAGVKSKLETSARFEVISPKAFAINADGKQFELEIASNSTTVKNPEFKQEEKKVTFVVEGQNGTRGVTQITIPKALLSGEIMVSIDGKVIPPESSDVVEISDTDQGMTLEINYHHSEHTIEISGTSVVPEFPLQALAAISAIVGIVAVMGRTRVFGLKA